MKVAAPSFLLILNVAGLFIPLVSLQCEKDLRGFGGGDCYKHYPICVTLGQKMAICSFLYTINYVSLEAENKTPLPYIPYHIGLC